MPPVVRPNVPVMLVHGDRLFDTTPDRSAD